MSWGSPLAALAEADRSLLLRINRTWASPFLDATMPVVTDLYKLAWFKYGAGPALPDELHSLLEFTESRIVRACLRRTTIRRSSRSNRGAPAFNARRHCSHRDAQSNYPGPRAEWQVG